ncbi:hypothetical protein HELRODRAFT_168324 [Helobdella robusta]|uniref:Uncharacterized protein n=1 Tax=Helobdella robusta TaxID=6412 RepID=T1F0F7_HELRO|nr:hypothetical protein HELRODRAFT_168324 [Helobdella robusta]ESO09352.1 hypothetical protein HELRODRAFT_168324 [Helobdella robusta]
MAEKKEELSPHKCSRVKFVVDNQRVSNFLLAEMKSNVIDAHLGFLQLNYKYKIAIEVNKYLGECIVCTNNHENCNLNEIEPNTNHTKHRMLVTLKAHQDLNMVEQLNLIANDDRSYTLLLTAQVIS